MISFSPVIEADKSPAGSLVCAASIQIFPLVSTQISLYFLGRSNSTFSFPESLLQSSPKIIKPTGLGFSISLISNAKKSPFLPVRGKALSPHTVHLLISDSSNPAHIHTPIGVVVPVKLILKYPSFKEETSPILIH